jgi:hypothetical protein
MQEIFGRSVCKLNMTYVTLRTKLMCYFPLGLLSGRTDSALRGISSEWSQLITALAWQKSGRLRIGELGIRFGYLDRNAVITILQNTVRGRLFGMTAQQMG